MGVVPRSTGARWRGKPTSCWPRRWRSIIRAGSPPFGAESRYVLAQVLAAHGWVEGALAQLDTLLAFRPRDADAIELRERLHERMPSR